MNPGINGRFYAAPLTGVQRFARELCNELYRRCAATVFLPADAPADQIPEHVRVLRGRQRGHVWEQIELPRMLRSEPVDVLLNPANAAPVAVRAQALVVHDVLPLTQPHWFSRRYVALQRVLVRRAIARAGWIFTSTEWSANQIVQTCGVRPEQVHVVTQGLFPFCAPAPAHVVAETLRRLEIECPYFLFVGSGDARKNLDLLVRVFDRLRTRCAVTLVAVGSRTNRIHKSHTHSPPDDVQLLAHVNDTDLRALYSGALALLFPSHAEGFGRPPLEALACGAPAVVGNYGCAGEVLGDHVPILAHDPEPWLKQLQRLVEDVSERDRLVQRGRPLLSAFDWARTADQVLAALQAGTPATASV